MFCKPEIQLEQFACWNQSPTGSLGRWPCAMVRTATLPGASLEHIGTLSWGNWSLTEVWESYLPTTHHCGFMSVSGAIHQYEDVEHCWNCNPGVLLTPNNIFKEGRAITSNMDRDVRSDGARGCYSNVGASRNPVGHPKSCQISAV